MLVVGVLGFGVTMLIFSFVESLGADYAERFLSGVFAAAVTPVAAAVIGNFITTEQGRARRLAFVSMTGIAGFLLGPMLGVFVTRFAANFLTRAMPAGSIAIPLAATAMLAFLVAATVAFAVPSCVVWSNPMARSPEIARSREFRRATRAAIFQQGFRGGGALS